MAMPSFISQKIREHKGERAKIGWLGIRIMCPNGATCPPTDCCFSELAKLYNST